MLILAFLVLGGGGGLYASVNYFNVQTQVRNQKATLTPSLTTIQGVVIGQPGKTATPGVVVLAKDTFQRAAQVFWGTASDGHLWAGDANSIEVFSITNGAGQIDHAQGTFNAVLGTPNTNAEVLVSASANQFVAGGKVNIGAVLRWTDANNWYKALIDGTNLQILSRVNGVTMSLAVMPFPAKGGVMYTLRFRVMGANLFARAWQSGQPEPATWMLTVANTALTQGLGGVRVLVQTATVVRVTSFLETSIAPAA